jgi:hypothetical protein
VSNNAVDVVFGPVCDYSVAPVARYAPFWHLPVLTSGANAHDFTEKKMTEYKTLTRLGQNFHDLAVFILDKLMETHMWFNLSLIYDARGRDDISGGFCYLAASSIIQLSKQRNKKNAFHMIDSNYRPPLDDMLRSKVGINFGGKCTI